ncbi:DUF485 domain-containing protein [Paraburkholderia caballeronis]|uniref:DUF485 domain-containing protein n=1 Tax=Paraburkholderia caballeronis TaxID=416943 RepID=UPI0010DB1C4E|nr:DUF485 domain-containing protein [Paraburkholderia caballeronis]TDV19709.1 uncharacterized protein DUF485 [Paraburkholderia caballeronis]TDV22308.1 uncharacterized protein DUF485 [Paraburkholderia caballeronis]TDV29212.1 uncharacterized protein DUF485 [Paraburkholderia caballeronis]TDV39149.1 uncharacterized protein DUF485 [Paraburkholderia caballeronis]
MHSVQSRNRISAAFAAVVVVIFAAFIGMFTFGRDRIAEPAVPGVPWSAIVEPLLIVVALALSVAYAIVIGRLERRGGEAR